MFSGEAYQSAWTKEGLTDQQCQPQSTAEKTSNHGTDVWKTGRRMINVLSNKEKENSFS